jgi:hypothetical protein
MTPDSEMVANLTELYVLSKEHHIQWQDLHSLEIDLTIKQLYEVMFIYLLHEVCSYFGICAVIYRMWYGYGYSRRNAAITEIATAKKSHFTFL